MQNGFVESFNGRMRDEFLNETLFRNLAHARDLLAAWVTDYNSTRPHAALGYQTPAGFALHLTTAIARPAARNENSACRAIAQPGVERRKSATGSGRGWVKVQWQVSPAIDAPPISTGLCKTVLITHGESGRSNNRGHRPVFPSMQQQEFESIYGALFPPSRFTLPVMRKMKDDGLTEEQLAMVAVVQREWASHHPRATARDPLTVEDVLSSKMIAYPFRKLMFCLVSDGGGALILTSAARARDFPAKPVYLRGMGGESIEGPMISQMESFTSSE